MQQDDVAAQIENYKQLVPLYFEDMQNSIAGMTNADDIENAYKNNKELMEALTATTADEVDMLGVMIKNTSNSTQKGLLETKRAKEIFKKFNADDDQLKLIEGNLTNDQMVSFAAEVDEETFKGSLDDLQLKINEFEKSDAGKISLTAEINTDRIKDASTEKKSLKSLIEDYNKAYSSGGFTEDEAAQIIAQNPDYIAYLTKVGDMYQLNTSAIQD